MCTPERVVEIGTDSGITLSTLDLRFGTPVLGACWGALSRRDADDGAKRGEPR
jgi:hypothetical protein